MAAIQRRTLVPICIGFIALTGCVSVPALEEPDDWLTEAASQNTSAEPPASAPSRQLSAAERARYDREAAAIVERGARVRSEAQDGEAGEQPDTETFTRENRERAEPPSQR
ncbi:MAG: hypothetical protein AAFX09_00870 [Pseudomonadota bacterium]